MEWIGSLYGGKEPLIAQWPVYGAGSALARGAVLMRGTTLGTDLNFAVVGASALVDVIGVIHEEHADPGAAGDDTNAGGTNYQTRTLITDPFALWRIEFDQADTMAIASSSSTTKILVTSGETNMQGGYLYAVSGTGAGTLQLVTTDDGSGDYTTKSAHGWDTTTALIKIVPRGHQLIKISTNGVNIGTDAAAGTGRVTVSDLKIKADSLALQSLNPINHSGLTGLNGLNVKFFAEIIFSNHIYSLLD